MGLLGSVRATATLSLAAAAIPVTALLVTLGFGYDHIPTRYTMERVRLQADVLLVEAVLIIIAAPLAGVAVAHWRRRAARFEIVGLSSDTQGRVVWSVAAWLLAAVASFVALSAIVAIAVLGPATWSLARPLAHSHATLWAATLALGGLGVLSAEVVDDPLDAVAAASVISAVLCGSIFFFGPLLVDLPTSVLNIGVLMNPTVAIAAAADLDIFRMPGLYGVSPLAHLRFDYPVWSAPVVFFLILAVSSLGIARRFNSFRDVDLIEGQRIAL